jgi:tetratricopeptide (TPR) repeat protein
MSAEQRQELEEAMAKREEQLKKSKELNDAFNAAMAAKEAKQWDVAIENFEKAGSVDPDQVVIWAQLAESYVQKSGTVTGAAKQEALEKGSATYEKVIALKPDDPAYHNNYALALAQGGKMAEAQAELEKAAQINPSGAGQYYYNLGAVLLNTGNQADSGIAFKKAIEADPKYANAHFQYGMFLLSQAKIGDDGSIVPPPGTTEALQKYLELAPNGAFAESAQGALQSLQGTISTEYVNPGSEK